MTREPDRFDAQAEELRRRVAAAEHYNDIIATIAAALRAEHASALELAAQECRSMADTISVTTQVRPFVALIEASRRIRALIPPAAAPAADGPLDKMKRALDEKVRMERERYASFCEAVAAGSPEDRAIAMAVPAAEMGKAEARQDGCWHDDKGHPCALPRVAELEDLLRGIEKTLAGQREREGASPGTVSDIVFKIVRKLAARVAPPEREGKSNA